MKNKFYFFALFLICGNALLLSVKAQAPAWSWATSHGAVSNDIGTSITTDANGNVYATGYFSDASITIGTTTLVNANSSGSSADIYVAKFDGSGNSLWAMSFGGTNDDRGQSIITDPAGNFYLTGSFQSASITFGSIQLNNVNSSNLSDVYLAKFNSSGTAIWATKGGGPFHDLSGSVGIDGAGNLYITGSFNSAAIAFGTFIQSNSSSNYNMFITKFDNNGNVKWLKRPIGANYDYANALVADANGNIYVTGSFNGPSITFGSTVLTNTLTNSPGFFLAKCDSAGIPIWAKSASGTAFNQGFGVTLDAAGDVIVTGQYGGTSLTFGSVTITNQNGGYGGAFIAKYDTAGNAIWAKSGDGVNTSSNNTGWSVATDINNQIFCTGSFTGPSITFGSTVLSNSGSLGTTDVFVAGFDLNGTPLWAKSAGGTNTEVGRGIATTLSGCLFVTGNSHSSSMAMDNITLTGTGTGSVFFAQLCPTTGEQEISTNDSHFIFPNPSSGIFYAELKSQQEITGIEIYNLIGEKVLSVSAKAQKLLLVDLSGRAAGLYFYRIKNGDQIIGSGKMIVD
ncbi:MAG: T9SS type A sorting domain-containing protein [Bacteroidia bacterium]|nr:T9SS type A sorting domain-containing protein [Bacteroidia bacterium]